MRWADLSRFPGGLLRFVWTTYALLLQLSTMGLEALRPLRPTLRRAEAARVLLLAAGWAVAVPVLTMTAALVLESGALLAAVALDRSPTVARAIVAAIGVAAFVLAWIGARGLRRGGWRGVPPAAAMLVAALVVGRAAWLILDDGLRVGLANALLELVAYPFRVAWMAAALLAALAALALVALPLRRGAAGAALDRERSRAAVTGALTLALAPIGVALVSALLFAALGAVALRVAQRATWGGTSALQCLPGPSSWRLRGCADLGLARLSPTDWGFRLFAGGLGPLVPALLVAGLLLALLLVIVVLPVALAAASCRTEARRDRRAAAQRQGRILGGALGAVSNALSGLILVLAVMVGAAWVWGAWLVADTPGAAPSAARLVAAIGIVVSATAIVARFTGSPLERARVVLDLPYDVANYLRVGQPGVVPPRPLMLRRMRALLAEIAAGGVDRVPYDRLVIASHSQGTVLSVATLFGDPAREPAAASLAVAAPGLGLPEDVSLLTCGSPLRQLYEERLPGQYAWVSALPASHSGLAPVTGTWVNLYRAGDPIGRALWAPDPDAPAALDPDTPAFDARASNGARAVDACLGTGGHTGYWAEPVLGDWLMRLVRACG